MNEIKLKTISKNGSVPETRLGDAFETLAIVTQLIDAHQKRSSQDAEVKGMVDGNPPFIQRELDEAAQSWRCNVNWRIGEAFLNIALSIYWDIISEASQKAQCVTEWSKSRDQNQEWSGIITEEFERLNRKDTSLNNMFRDSNHDMVLYRMGPVMWHDAFDYRASHVRCANLLLPDGSPSDINCWKTAVVRSTYSADELYSFVRYPESATRRGWDVELARKVLMQAIPISSYPHKQYDWEWYQQRIRNNDIYWSMQSERIPVAHVFQKEFPKPGDNEGRISHFSVVEGMPNKDYLFKHVGRYSNWRQAICPFYYDTGDGTHHSVKGLGVKAYGFLDKINRLMCHEVDIAFAGSALNFQFKSQADKEALQLMQFGPMNVWPEGLNLLPISNTAQLIQAPGIVRSTLLSTVSSNLSQYREGLQQEKGGNPITAREVNWRANNQNFIKKSGVAYFFEQGDDFYAERFRRAANPNLTMTSPGGKEALDFQKRCFERGVPKEALQKVDSVTMTRTIGAGSADARLQSLSGIVSMVQMYDETGRRRILEDFTAAMVGYDKMRAYIPEVQSNPTMDYQRSQAQDKIALLRDNVMPIVTAEQNPVVYASTFIQAGSEALAAMTQGTGNPMDVVAFVDNCGRAAAMHLQRIEGDITRRDVFAALTEQLTEMGRQNDEVKRMVEQQMRRNGQNGQRQQQVASEEQLKEAKLANDISRKERKLAMDMQAKEAKTRQALAQSEASHRQQLAINDVNTAQEIRNNRLKQNNGKPK